MPIGSGLGSTSSSPEVEASWQRLAKALSRGRTLRHCLRLWSRFVRTRDLFRCVLCGVTNGVIAHHIVRRSFYPAAQVQPGNGITLCRTCHREPHSSFNGRPNLNLPMDAEGGEQIELMVSLFVALRDDARSRDILNDRYYFLHPVMLNTFKRLQGFPESKFFAGTPLEQACQIWMAPPQQLVAALVRANF